MLTDITGPASSGNKLSVQGVQAGVLYAKDHGYTVHYMVGDTQSSPSGALTAAQRLVQQGHVLAVIAVSALAFGAASYLHQQNIPVIGYGEDGPEWQTDLNMFSVAGPLHTNLVPTVYGDFFKAQGVTTVGTVGYSVSPSSSEYAKAAADSAKHAGLKVGYVNGNFPFGSTNVGPETLAMKNAGVQGLYAPIDPNTAFALVEGLRQAGDNPKVALFPTGYGADLLQAGPATISLAQGVYFSLAAEPVEMNTSATQMFQKYLRQAGVPTVPAEDTYDAWASMGLLVRGLQAAGANPTQASLITALSGIHNWDDLGLWGGKSLDINDRNSTQVSGTPDNCIWVTRFKGSTFHLVSGADPICGTIVPGINETPG